MTDRPEQRPDSPTYDFRPDDVPTLRKIQAVGTDLRRKAEGEATSPRSAMQVFAFKTIADLCERIADEVELRDMLMRGEP